jgi:CelD/BcsL family acetyltransferase involved in cellulose biosynthesis
VRDEGEILFPASLHFQRAFRGVGLHSHPNRLVENPVHNVEGFSLEAQAILVGEIVKAAAKDVVLGNDLFEIKRLLKPLQPMGRRAASFQRFGNCHARLRLKRDRQFLQEMRDVIVQRRSIEMLRGRQLFYLVPPLREQCVTFLPD